MLHDLSGTCNDVGIGRAAQNAYAPVESDGAGRPTEPPITAEPAMRVFVVAVRQIEQSNQHVHVQKGDHSSSRNLFTIVRSGRERPGFGTNNGTPFLILGGALPA